MDKKYIVTVKVHGSHNGKDRQILRPSLSYNAADPMQAAQKALDYLDKGGSYHDLHWVAHTRTVFFRVKESGTPKGEGTTIVERNELPLPL